MNVCATPDRQSYERRHGQEFSGHSLFALIVLTLLLSLFLAACESSGSSSPTSATGTGTSQLVVPTPTGATALPIDCPDPNKPTILTGARMTLQPASGPVGTPIAIAITGLQPGCHLTLDLALAPPLAETGGQMEASPRQTGQPVQWVTVSSAGAAAIQFCACQTIWFSNVPLASVTPAPHSSTSGAFGPKVGDYVFLTVAGPGVPDPSPLFARFVFTA
jgi:hypothetical protein